MAQVRVPEYRGNRRCKTAFRNTNLNRNLARKRSRFFCADPGSRHGRPGTELSNDPGRQLDALLSGLLE